MIKQSVHSSVLAAKLASNFLSEGGLLTLTGAKAALDGGTPGEESSNKFGNVLAGFRLFANSHLATGQALYA